MVVLIGVAMLTVVLSWTVLNMVFTLRYADQHRGLGRAGIDFNDSNAEDPTYRDFAHVAFKSECVTRRIRRTALSHACCRTCSVRRPSVARSISLPA
jgi:uncharacterized membrane protein